VAAGGATIMYTPNINVGNGIIRFRGDSDANRENAHGMGFTTSDY